MTVRRRRWTRIALRPLRVWRADLTPLDVVVTHVATLVVGLALGTLLTLQVIPLWPIP